MVREYSTKQLSYYAETKERSERLLQQFNSLSATPLTIHDIEQLLRPKEEITKLYVMFPRP